MALLSLNINAANQLVVPLLLLLIFGSAWTVEGAALNISIAANTTTAFNTSQFCSTRPFGLYCNPENIFQRIECPNGSNYTCPLAPDEFCQERGVLKGSGFNGGVARCVPNLNMTAVSNFCAVRRSGVYCFGNDLNNIRVECPHGLIYRCASPSFPHSKKCFQAVTARSLADASRASSPTASATNVVFDPKLSTSATTTASTSIDFLSTTPTFTTAASLSLTKTTSTDFRSSSVSTPTALTAVSVDITSTRLDAVSTASSSTVNEIPSVSLSSPSPTLMMSTFTVNLDGGGFIAGATGCPIQPQITFFLTVTSTSTSTQTIIAPCPSVSSSTTSPGTLIEAKTTTSVDVASTTFSSQFTPIVSQRMSQTTTSSTSMTMKPSPVTSMDEKMASTTRPTATTTPFTTTAKATKSAESTTFVSFTTKTLSMIVTSISSTPTTSLKLFATATILTLMPL